MTVAEGTLGRIFQRHYQSLRGMGKAAGRRAFAYLGGFACGTARLANMDAGEEWAGGRDLAAIESADSGGNDQWQRRAAGD